MKLVPLFLVCLVTQATYLMLQYVGAPDWVAFPGGMVPVLLWVFTRPRTR